MFRRAYCFVLLTVLLSPIAQAAEFHLNVGATGRTCDFTTVQEAVDAASAAVEDTTYIHIARDQAYTAQQIDIDGKNIHLLGGYATCAMGTPDTIKTELNGAGGARRSIINLRGSTRNVRFERLVLRGGDELRDNESYGGALDITQGPHERVVVRDAQFIDNAAGYGGAISLRWSDPENQAGAYLFLSDNVTISSNRGSYGGGGIYCRNGWINLLGSGSSVFQNTAGGSTEGGSPPGGGAYGGGLLLDGCIARISAWGFTPAIWSNTATGPGGGVAALNPRTLVDVGNRVSFSPTRISANHSDRFGGAFTIESGAEVFAYDAVIEDNSATQGGGAVALYSNQEGTSGAHTRFVATAAFDDAPARRACSSEVECNVIRNNDAYDGTAARHGAAFRISSDPGRIEVRLEGTRVSGNRGASLVKNVAGGSAGVFTANGALFDRNETSQNLFDMGEGFCFTRVVASTLADNEVQGAAIFRLNGFYTNPPFSLARSVVYHPSTPLISISGGAIPAGHVQHVVANDLTGVPAETGPGGRALNVAGAPAFVDAANANYFLQASSLGVDFAAPEPTDLTRDRGRRDIDVAAAVDRFGIQDLGAFERPNGAPMFLDADLPAGTVGTAYTYRVTVASGGEVVRFSADSLPTGLVIHPDSGEITGTPATQGTFNPTLYAESAGETTSLLRRVDIAPSGVVDGLCGYAIAMTHTEAPSSDLCDMGTPTPVTGDGPWTWTCEGINGGASPTCTAEVAQGPPVIETSSLPDGMVGVPYDAVLVAQSALQPVAWQATGLPPGLTLDGATGRIGGAPTQAGLFEQVLVAASNEVGMGTRTLQLLVLDVDREDAVFGDGFESASQR